jgi:hypothetical protein
MQILSSIAITSSRVYACQAEAWNKVNRMRPITNTGRLAWFKSMANDVG